MKRSFRHIRAFLQVAKEGSFTRAAEALHISQPALTVQIKQLEEALGIQLLNRDRRTVTLTHAGSSMLTPLRHILDQFDDAVEQAHDLVGLRRGLLTIATLPSIAAASLPEIIYHYRKAYPNIEIRLSDVVAEEIVTMVKNGTADVGIGPQVSRDRAIEFQHLLTDRMDVFFPADHPLAVGPDPTLARLSDFPHILMAQETSVRKVVQNALEVQNLTIDVACEAAYLSTAISMVKAGLGISILPLSVLHAASCEGIYHRPINNKGLYRRLGFLTLRRTQCSPAVTEFIQMAKQFYREPS